MRSKLMLLVVGVLVLGLLAGCGTKGGAGYSQEQQAGQYKVSMALNTKPVVGDNHAAVKITDSAGAVVTVAQVMIDYSMPAMPGMPAMNYSATAQLSGTDYMATINLPMSGSWNVAVRFTINGQTEVANFSVDAR